MTPSPAGWPRLSSALFYDDGPAAIAFLEAAFGFTTRLRIDAPNGAVDHAELVYGEAVVIVGDGRRRPWARSPHSLQGANTQALFLYVDDVDAHCARAAAAGAIIVIRPTTTDYGPEHWVDRGYEALDPQGHHWWFAQRLERA